MMIAVLGDTAHALACAALLARDGHDVVRWQPPQSRHAVEADRKVAAAGCEGEWTATLAVVTPEVMDALSSADTLIVIPPRSGWDALAALVLPLLESRHMVVLPRGRFRSLAWACWLRDHGRQSLPTFVESNALPVVAHMVDERVHLDAVIGHPVCGVLPADRTERAAADVGLLSPGAHFTRHVVAAALADPSAVLRAVTLVLNWGAIERSPVPFRLFEDGFTPAVARVAAAADAERRALAAALDVDLPDAVDALQELGLGHGCDLWSAVNGSRALTGSVVPAGPASRSAGGSSGAAEATTTLAPLVGLASALDVAVPVLASLHTCAATAAEVGSVESVGECLDALGLAGLSGAALSDYLASGERVW
jgi:hypothetical protein